MRDGRHRVTKSEKTLATRRLVKGGSRFFCSSRPVGGICLRTFAFLSYFHRDGPVLQAAFHGIVRIRGIGLAR